MSYSPVQESKKTKKVRLTLCTLFLINIFFLAMPFVGLKVGDAYQTMTAFNLMYYITSTDPMFVKMAIFSMIFAVLPVAGFLTAAFDKRRNIKSAVGLIVSVAGICAILFLGVNSLSIGAIMSLLIYLATAFCSVIMVMANLSVK